MATGKHKRFQFTSLAREVLHRRYLWKDANGRVIETPDQMFRRVANAVAAAEKNHGASEAEVEAMAERFFRLFSNQATFAAQSDYAAAWLAAGNKASELHVYSDFLGRTLDSVIGLQAASLPPEIDLAMCVYHAFSVNAPGIATKCLDSLMGKLPALTAAGFAAALIKALGKKQYGNWLDAPGDGSNRYDRTRRAVWARPDLWDAKIAKTLMPKDL